MLYTYTMWLTMLDIFANFDPEYNILGSTAFWLIMCISPLFLYTLARGRFRSITTKFLYRNPLRKVNNTGIGFGYTASIFLLILYYNFIGIIPYTFSWTRHLVVNLRLSLLLWLRIVMIRFSSNPTRFIAHLVPTGTPLLLTPFLVLIETISIRVRPLTLSVRLTANIMTGHIIMSIITSPIITSFYIIFEGAICIVQAYIFTLLPTLYIDEHV